MDDEPFFRSLQQLQEENDTLRRSNAALQEENERLRGDPDAVCARRYSRSRFSPSPWRTPDISAFPVEKSFMRPTLASQLRRATPAGQPTDTPGGRRRGWATPSPTPTARTTTPTTSRPGTLAGPKRRHSSNGNSCNGNSNSNSSRNPRCHAGQRQRAQPSYQRPTAASSRRSNCERPEDVAEAIQRVFRQQAARFRANMAAAPDTWDAAVPPVPRETWAGRHRLYRPYRRYEPPESPREPFLVGEVSEAEG